MARLSKPNDQAARHESDVTGPLPDPPPTSDFARLVEAVKAGAVQLDDLSERHRRRIRRILDEQYGPGKHS